MTTRALGPGAAWRWLVQAINLGRNNPRAVFGAIALVALVAAIPNVLQVVVGRTVGLESSAGLGVAGLLALLPLLVFPLLFAGGLRVIDAAENGRPTHATAVFEPFKAGHGAARLIGFSMLLWVMYLVVFVLAISLFGKDFARWYLEFTTAVQAAQQQGGDPQQLMKNMSLPENAGALMILGSLFGLFLGAVYTIGLGQIALARRPVGAALGDGLGGALKNLLPLLLLAVLITIGLFVLVGVVMLLAALLVGLLGQAVAEFLLLPVYMAMLLLMYVVMFGVMYYMWRDICGNPPTDGQVPSDRVEV